MWRGLILAASAVAIISRSGGRECALVLAEGPVAGAVDRPDFPPEAISPAPPDSPTDAKLAGIAGTVLIQARVGTDGRADHVTAIRSRGEVDRYALDAVRRWRFRPATLAREPIDSWIAIPIEFFIAGEPIVHPLALIWPPCEPANTSWPSGSPPWGLAPARAEMLVRKNGHVGTIHVVTSPPGAEALLVGALKRWTFTPARVDGLPVDVWIEVEVGPAPVRAIPSRAGSP